MVLGGIAELGGQIGENVAKNSKTGRALFHDAKRAENIFKNGKGRISQRLKATKAMDKFENYGSGNTSSIIKASLQAVVGSIENSNPNSTNIPYRNEEKK